MHSVFFRASSSLILHDIIHLQRPPQFAVLSKVKSIIILPAEQADTRSRNNEKWLWQQLSFHHIDVLEYCMWIYEGIYGVGRYHRKSFSVSRDLINSPAVLHFHQRCTSLSPPKRGGLAAESKIQTLINKGFSSPNYETI